MFSSLHNYKFILTLLGTMTFGMSLYYAYFHDTELPTRQEVELPELRASAKVEEASKKAHSMLTSLVHQDEVNPNRASTLFQQAQQLRHCQSVPKTREALTIWIDEANNLGEPQAYIEQVVNRYETCAEAPNASPLAILIEAIDLGSEQAVIELWTWSEQEFFNAQQLGELNQAQGIEHRHTFKALKYDSAHHAAMKGGEQALLRLIKAYQSSSRDNSTPDLVKAYAYTQFALETSTNNDFYGKAQWFQRSLASKLNDQQINQAMTIVEQWLKTTNES